MGYYSCYYEDCGAFFDRPWKLKNHILKHKDKRSYKCDVEQCGKVYFSKSHCIRHKKMVHGSGNMEVTVFKCSHQNCSSSFITKWGLQRHEKKSHRFQCDVCDKHFRNAVHFANHVAQHSDEPLYKCRYCGKTFKHTTKCNKHESQHTLSTRYPITYKCDRCQFSCFFYKEIVSHIKFVCFPESPYFVCTYKNCNKTFRFKRNLVEHTKACHKEPRFICNYKWCGKHFGYKKSLSKHLKLHLENKIKISKPKKIRKSTYTVKLTTSLIHDTAQFKIFSDQQTIVDVK